MQDQFSLPSCFFPGADHPSAATRSGESVTISVYRTKVAGLCRLITVTWCKNLLAHGLSVSIEGSDPDSSGEPAPPSCKVELRPWRFWKKHGSKRFHVAGRPVDVFWDLKTAKFSAEPEPCSGYYVAVISDDEVVLLLGDLKKEAFRRSRSPPSGIDATLVSKKEHVFGKKKFSTKAKFKGESHDISVECSSSGDSDPEMVIRVDGHVVIHVKHLHWKFRGNGVVSVNKMKVEVYWDVHDWLFGPGLRHALFIFKPVPALPVSLPEEESDRNDGSSEFCLFLYAWKVE